MRLVKFEVSNFRSITKNISIDFDNYTVIVGANNAGKSNLLNALIVALNLIKTSSYVRVTRGSTRGILNIGRNEYIRERDFPFNLKKTEHKHTIFKLEFNFNQEERDYLREHHNLNLSKDIVLKFDFTSENKMYDIIMRGKASQKFNKEKHNIAQFISDNLVYEYIPCIRDTSMSENIFQKALESAFLSLNNDPDYKECLDIMKRKENEVCRNLEKHITETISEYIPNVSNVHFEFDSSKRRIYRNGSLYIDDGVDTELEFKGDGIKSLMAIALLSENASSNQNSIICIEEPEAHLHSSAIYGIKKILKDVSKKSQIIMTTHSSILVDKDKISNNILVTKNGIKKCKRIKEVKEILGIQLSDELMGNEVILLVEGQSDERIIRMLLKEYISIDEYIQKHKVKIINMRGATKASNLAIYYNSLLMPVHIVLDNDASGKGEYEKLITKGIVLPKDITMAMSSDMNSSEIEDMISCDIYKDYILEQYGIDIKKKKQFKKKNREWSYRMQEAFSDEGKPYDKTIENSIKEKIADCVEEVGCDSLYPNRKNWVKNLAEALETKIQQINNDRNE